MRQGDEQGDEVRELARLGFDALRGATGGIHAVHQAVASRAFAAGGAAARPAHLVHDAISGGVYGAVAGGARLVGLAADAGLARRSPGERALSTSPRGALLLGAVNGLIGDALEREGSPLDQMMSVRVSGRPVPAERTALAAAYPHATGRIVVLLHGLMETELAWRPGAGVGERNYAEGLRRELGCTPLELRYNSGRHISENGRSLSDLLERLTRAWPTEAETISLVGHSMGGLVARSACHQAAQRGDGWVARVRQVVSLGSPHVGAPLAQGLHWASALLHALPETRPFARLLRRRSAGIRDLRQGSLVDEDWRGRDPDALRAGACREVPLLEGATHCFVAASVTRSPRHPVGRLLGDCLVLEPSASGRSRPRRIPFEAGMHLGGAHHLALLNHPEVYEQLREWLSEDAARG
jgi:pimeloyl-ACP methyl ester carboxylesterase